MPCNRSNKRSSSRYLSLGAAAAALLLVLAGPEPVRAANGHSVGLGLHYWQTVDDLFDGAGLEEDGVSFLLAYQYTPSRGLLRFEVDLEYFEDGFGGSPDSAIAPVAYLLVGRKLYVGAGIGLTYSSGLDGDFSDPFFAGRFGYDIALLPGLSVDLNVNYRTNTFDELGDLDTDTFTLGVVPRITVGRP